MSEMTLFKMQVFSATRFLRNT